MRLVNDSNGKVLADQILVADTFSKRLRGLMFTLSFPSNSAMHIIPCQSVHTFFMNYAIDVVHLDINFQIIAIEENLVPRKFGRMYRGTVSVVELPAGQAAATETKVGQYLKKTERGEM